ncbi:hypothetical protein A1O1_08059 [Capronia coronata CBS 617.96]|uniref:RGS domain-containing protein n=1 Tax=Capronia coronata CBS 617.96 TaxID=1182541 RepID=W9XYG9_9EURO|nr:uncharacterized protein A1O1_08059 [Capronia coronata CBS 617.96]EXJ81991.1 hypothetical protein A1O1_08059 [Capronia coronata CBS 617.96]
MIKRRSTKRVWPYTPEPSPRLEPSIYSLEEVPEVCEMPSDEVPRARPISVVGRREGLMSPARPTLDDVLANKAPSPYTLAAFTAFLSQQHCLETLEFTTEAKKYADKFDEASASLAGMPITVDAQEGWELIQDWTRILDIYVKPGAPREINLPAEERDDLLEQAYELRPPPPEALDAAVKRMYDLMSESIFIPFCNSLQQLPYAQTYDALSDYGHLSGLDPPRLTYDDRGMHRQMISARRRRSPPNTSAASFETSRTLASPHRSAPSSSLSSALGRQSGTRLTHHISPSSVVSESALTDSSGGPDSPPAGEPDTVVMTPPTTPPTSDVGMSGMGQVSGAASVHAAKIHRSESGGWKKAMKLFGGSKKKNEGSDG